MTRWMMKSSFVAYGLMFALTACGPDNWEADDSEGVSGANRSELTPSAEGGSPTGCPDHPNVTEGDRGECHVSAGIRAPMTQNLTLDAANTWYLDGSLVVGDDSAETILTIEAGTTVLGGDGSFILIQRGSKIMAEGSASAPIVLTSAKAAGSRGPQDWGGLVLNGKAPINNATNPDGSARGEAGTGIYGGNDPADNSGTLKYVRVEFAGNKVDLENELNGIAFQGVGSGTTVDYVQTHMTSDDGVELFGGTVNLKHIVVTGADDDSFDWTGGWSGKAQFLVAKQSPDSGTNAERGIEADNLKGANSAEPYSDPTLSNFTLIARDGNSKEGMKLREGTKGAIYNAVVTGFGGPCVDVDHSQTEANVDASELQVKNSVLNCTGGASEAGNKGEILIAGVGNVTADPNLGGANGWTPEAGSPALGIGAGPTDSFFDSVDYAGAFDGTTDWTDGWIETATR